MDGCQLHFAPPKSKKQSPKRHPTEWFDSLVNTPPPPPPPQKKKKESNPRLNGWWYPLSCAPQTRTVLLSRAFISRSGLQPGNELRDPVRWVLSPFLFWLGDSVPLKSSTRNRKKLVPIYSSRSNLKDLVKQYIIPPPKKIKIYRPNSSPQIWSKNNPQK